MLAKPGYSGVWHGNSQLSGSSVAVALAHWWSPGSPIKVP